MTLKQKYNVGLNKAERLRLIRAARAKRNAAAKEAAVLNPGWPWQALPFNFSYYGLTALSTHSKTL